MFGQGNLIFQIVSGMLKFSKRGAELMNGILQFIK